jgi:hypothetical protein
MMLLQAMVKMAMMGTAAAIMKLVTEPLRQRLWRMQRGMVPETTVILRIEGVECLGCNERLEFVNLNYVFDLYLLQVF